MEEKKNSKKEIRGGSYDIWNKVIYEKMSVSKKKI